MIRFSSFNLAPTFASMRATSPSVRFGNKTELIKGVTEGDLHGDIKLVYDHIHHGPLTTNAPQLTVSDSYMNGNITMAPEGDPVTTQTVKVTAGSTVSGDITFTKGKKEANFVEVDESRVIGNIVNGTYVKK
ncbi:MAG: hypothetical protein QE263_06110 [Vampirovibrionales bacterium]|nr:hypothetical protein [Vampirovibrionales bacterium]